MLRESAVSALVLGVLLCGCAGLPGMTGTISASSDPPGLTVMVDGVERGLTPLTVHDIARGRHTVTLARNGTPVFTTEVNVTAKGISQVVWNEEGSALPLPTGMVTYAPVALRDHLKGYRGGGEYLTRLSFDLVLAPGASKVNISQAAINFRTENFQMNPHWEFDDKMYGNTDDLLEQGEIFPITVTVPRLMPNETFTLEIMPADGPPLVITRRVPPGFGLEVTL